MFKKVFKSVKSFIRIACFLVALALVLIYVSSVLKFKYDDIYIMKKFYEQENDTVDVLVVGSSHAFADFNVAALWDKYGIAAYTIGASNQPMWNTYYYLKEALKTQSPKLIILEGYKLYNEDEYSDDYRIVLNNYGLKWSEDKIESIKISSPESKYGEMLNSFARYHSRYNALTSDDFLDDYGYNFYDGSKGYFCLFGTLPSEAPNVEETDETDELTEKTETYYRKILELAQSEDIPIVVMVSPYQDYTYAAQRAFNRGKEIADEYDVDFINYNSLVDEIGIDYSTDVPDNSHLNYKGSIKYMSYVGKYIKENFEIPDRRDDENYADWEEFARYLEHTSVGYELTQNYDGDDLASKLNNSEYYLIISVDCDIKAADAAGSKLCKELGISTENGIYYKPVQNGTNSEVTWSVYGDNEGKMYGNTTSYSIMLSRSLDPSAEEDAENKLEDETENDTFVNNIMINNESQKVVENGINVVVYDPETDKVIDCFGLDADQDYTLVR